jgi:hypothetical protein
VELIWFPVQHPITQASNGKGVCEHGVWDGWKSNGWSPSGSIVGWESIRAHDGWTDGRTEIETPHPHSDHYSCCHTWTRSTQPLPLERRQAWIHILLFVLPYLWFVSIWSHSTNHSFCPFFWRMHTTKTSYLSVCLRVSCPQLPSDFLVPYWKGYSKRYRTNLILVLIATLLYTELESDFTDFLKNGSFLKY